MALSSLTVERAVVSTITMVGPGRGNAMGPALWDELPRVMSDLDADPEVRAIVLRGRGDHFCYGLDLVAMAPELAPFMAGSNAAGPRTELLALVRRLQGAMNAVESCRTPVIAAIHGWCIGGGIDLVCACDVRLASAEARFSVREVRVAMVADLGTLQRLPHIVGDGHARELALTGRDVDADEALRMGLVTAVHSDPAALFAAAEAVAQQIALNPPLVVQGVKQVMNWSRDHSVADGLEYVAVWNAAFLQSEDLAEAMTAFAERRPAKFTGR